MPTFNGKKPTVTLHSNNWGNSDRKYIGEYSWKKEQFYNGEFLRDSIHGQGTYKWEDQAVFEGSFYTNKKEGYATVSFHNNCNFEGLFVGNKPFGPGIFTYANGRQDAGFWMGRKLVRLGRPVDYIIPRLAPTSVAKIKLLQFRRLIPLDDLKSSADDILEKYNYPSSSLSTLYSSLIYDQRSIFFDKQIFEKTFFVNMTQWHKEFPPTPETCKSVNEETRCLETYSYPVPAHCLRSHTMFDMNDTPEDAIDICDWSSSSEGDNETGILYNLTKYGTLEKPLEEPDELREPILQGMDDDVEDEASETKLKLPKIVSWNRSELCTEMLKQIFRYRVFEDKLNFNLAKLMLGARTDFRRTGKREKECLHFLKMCSLGPPHAVKDLLCNYEISEELMDARGNNSLMFAVAADQLEVIDILLDYGVDVNTFNDEGLTPLNLCLLRRLAQANKISNWEAAFLPKETDKVLVPEGYSQNDSWDSRESIPSLDRIFGDGMSLNDSKTSFNRFPSPLSSPSLSKDTCEKTTAPVSCARDDSQSQITVVNVLKSPKSTNTTSEDVSQLPSSNRSLRARGRSPDSGPIGSTEVTPKIEGKIIPKSNKRDEYERSITKNTSDKYLFEFSFEKKPPELAQTGSRKKMESPKSLKGRGKKEESVKAEVLDAGPDEELMEK